MLSFGDTHAAQGDGEICGTAIESPMTVAVKIDLIKGANFAFPPFETDGPVTRHFDEKGYKATTGIGEDLMQAAKDAVSVMIDWVSATTGMSALDTMRVSAQRVLHLQSEWRRVPNSKIGLHSFKIIKMLRKQINKVILFSIPFMRITLQKFNNCSCANTTGGRLGCHL